MTGFYPRQYYESLLASIPEGAEYLVMKILLFHIGLPNAILKPDLLETCERNGKKMDERQLRIVIVKLRKAGVPVCACT